MYTRPFDHGVDDTGLAMHVHRVWWIQATTARSCLSREAAHEEAITLMRNADARRRKTH
jgi:hypothetical protein